MAENAGGRGSSREKSFWQAKAAFAKSFARVAQPPKNPGARADQLCKVAPGLYLSSCHLETDKNALKAAGVTHILQVGHELVSTHSKGFTYKRMNVFDLEEQDLVSQFPECFHFIDQGRAAGGVLVHCLAGISRSASVVIAYLMWSCHMPLEEARAQVKAARPAVNPNLGFMLQLRLFEMAGCTTEGWPSWDLDRFLEAKANATLRETVDDTSCLETVRRAAPPSLQREDSCSMPNSPSRQAPGDGAQPGPGSSPLGRLALPNDDEGTDSPLPSPAEQLSAPPFGRAVAAAAAATAAPRPGSEPAPGLAPDPAAAFGAAGGRSIFRTISEKERFFAGLAPEDVAEAEEDENPLAAQARELERNKLNSLGPAGPVPAPAPAAAGASDGAPGSGLHPNGLVAQLLQRLRQHGVVAHAALDHSAGGAHQAQAVAMEATAPAAELPHNRHTITGGWLNSLDPDQGPHAHPHGAAGTHPTRHTITGGTSAWPDQQQAAGQTWRLPMYANPAGHAPRAGRVSGSGAVALSRQCGAAPAATTGSMAAAAEQQSDWRHLHHSGNDSLASIVAATVLKGAAVGSHLATVAEVPGPVAVPPPLELQQQQYTLQQTDVGGTSAAAADQDPGANRSRTCSSDTGGSQQTAGASSSSSGVGRSSNSFTSSSPPMVGGFVLQQQQPQAQQLQQPELAPADASLGPDSSASVSTGPRAGSAPLHAVDADIGPGSDFSILEPAGLEPTPSRMFAPEEAMAAALAAGHGDVAYGDHGSPDASGDWQGSHGAGGGRPGQAQPRHQRGFKGPALPYGSGAEAEAAGQSHPGVLGSEKLMGSPVRADADLVCSRAGSLGGNESPRTAALIRSLDHHQAAGTLPLSQHQAPSPLQITPHEERRTSAHHARPANHRLAHTTFNEGHSPEGPSPSSQHHTIAQAPSPDSLTSPRTPGRLDKQLSYCHLDALEGAPEAAAAASAAASGASTNTSARSLLVMPSPASDPAPALNAVAVHGNQAAAAARQAGAAATEPVAIRAPPPIRTRAPSTSAGGADQSGTVGTPIHKRVLRSLTSLLRSVAGQETEAGAGAGASQAAVEGVAAAVNEPGGAAVPMLHHTPHRRLLWPARPSQPNLPGGVLQAEAPAAVAPSAVIAAVAGQPLSPQPALVQPVLSPTGLGGPLSPAAQLQAPPPSPLPPAAAAAAFHAMPSGAPARPRSAQIHPLDATSSDGTLSASDAFDVNADLDIAYNAPQEGWMSAPSNIVHPPASASHGAPASGHAAPHRPNVADSAWQQQQQQHPRARHISLDGSTASAGVLGRYAGRVGTGVGGAGAVPGQVHGLGTAAALALPPAPGQRAAVGLQVQVGPIGAGPGAVSAGPATVRPYRSSYTGVMSMPAGGPHGAAAWRHSAGAGGIPSVPFLTPQPVSRPMAGQYQPPLQQQQRVPEDAGGGPRRRGYSHSGVGFGAAGSAFAQGGRASASLYQSSLAGALLEVPKEGNGVVLPDVAAAAASATAWPDAARPAMAEVQQQQQHARADGIGGGAGDDNGLTSMLTFWDSAMAQQAANAAPSSAARRSFEAATAPANQVVAAVAASAWDPTATGGGHAAGSGQAVAAEPQAAPRPADAVPPAPARHTAGLQVDLPEASLLRPVLARRLMPMPSPSYIASTPLGTPRDARGGGGGSVLSPPSDTSSQSPSPRGAARLAVDSLSLRAGVSSAGMPRTVSDGLASAGALDRTASSGWESSPERQRYSWSREGGVAAAVMAMQSSLMAALSPIAMSPSSAQAPNSGSIRSPCRVGSEDGE